MDFYFAGGAGEIGGSCVYLKAGGHGILFDSGIRQSGGKDPLPDFRTIQENGGVDLILVSHAHMDHTGTLPMISKAYPQARIYMTRMAMEQTRVLLYDSLKLMERREEEIPQYSQTDVVNMLERIIPVSFQTQTVIPEYDMTLTAYPAGHIAGAACLYLQTQDGTVLYTGDVSGFAQQTIEGIGIPRLRPDVLIMEATYGDRLHAARRLEEERLVKTIAECAEKKMKILIPAFALGRAQEVLLILKKAMANGEMPHIPVYVDGMVRDMNTVYTAHPSFLKNALARRILKGEEPFYSDDIRPVLPKDDREALAEKQGPAVFVSSSGMLTGGPSVTYARKLLPRENSCVILTGYQDEESPGRKLLQLLEEKENRRILLDGQTLQAACRVEMIGLSAHADQMELCGIAERTGARQIILVHGNSTAIEELGNALVSDSRRQIYHPETGEWLQILLHKKREQLKTRLPFTMQKETFDPEKDPVWLWNYWNTHYKDRSFTPEEAAFIWYGKQKMTDPEAVQTFCDALLNSHLFSRHPKRLYLLRPNTEEEMTELRRKAQPQMQDVEAEIRQMCAREGDGADSIFPAIRKIGFHQQEHRAVLTVDFPDAADPGQVQRMSESLREKLGWTVSLRENMNHQSASDLLNRLFPGRVLRISYYQEKKLYQIRLKDYHETDRETFAQFEKTTGWKLSAEEQAQNAGLSLTPESTGHSKASSVRLRTETNGWFSPPPGVARLEQNLAFSVLEQIFEDAPAKPYKRGKKNDSSGVYLELTFLSPAIGRRCAESIRKAAGQTGWHYHISESVNQNKLFAIAEELCEKYGILQAKNCAYLPGEKCVQIRNVPDTPVPEEMCQEFLERTGCTLLAGSCKA